MPEIDLLVDLTADDPLVFGARLTGGGFGGSVVLLVRHGSAHEVAARVSRDYSERSRQTPTVLVPQRR